MKRCAAIIGTLIILGSTLAAFGQETPPPVAAKPARSIRKSVRTATPPMGPPMGWNSWDGYGTTVKEADVKANAKWLAEHLKSAGWQYVVVDMEWFVTNPTPEGNSKNSQYTVDTHGRYTPALNRFPSAANDSGFKPLADYVHSLGLKFGIHILRGIPKQAVEKNLPIAGSSYRAAEAADTSDTCPWNPDNYGLDATKPGAQAYYNSIAKLYASWTVDLIKVDCISSRPYKGDEIRMLSTALAKTGRGIVLSLSPGPAPLEKTEEMREYAPLGRLGPAPGWGQARDTRLTHDEQRTLMTLWSIFPSPLMVGGKLPSADAWTISLLTNPEVIAMDQHSTGNHPVVATDKTVVWVAQSTLTKTHYLALFNVSESSQTLQYAWKDLGFPAAKYKLRDLWQRKEVGVAASMEVTVPAHGVVLYGLSPAPTTEP